MADEYKTSSLGSVANVRSGYAFRSVDMGDIGYPIIKIKNVVPPTVDITDCDRVPKSVIENISNVDRYAIEAGDILIAMTGATVGKVGRFPLTYERFYLNQRVGKVYLTARSKADYRYLYYVLSQDIYVRQMFGTADGSAQANISGTQIERLEIPFPALPEQRAIAHILGTLDDKIELNRQMNETLEAMARALFKSWFVDFDPVRAKAEGRDTGLPRRLADLFPGSFEDSELGPVPCGWHLRKWGDLISLEYGKALTGYDREDGAYAVYGTNGRIGTHSEALCPHAGIIVGRKGAYRGVHYCDAPFFVIDTAFYLAPKVPLEMRWAYYELLRMDINSMDSGSAIPSTSRKEFCGISVVAPPVLLQQFYVELLRPMWIRQARNEIESRTLASLRDTLLPKLISGELRVKDAERFLEERGL